MSTNVKKPAKVEIFGSKKRICPGKRGHMLALLLLLAHGHLLC